MLGLSCQPMVMLTKSHAHHEHFNQIAVLYGLKLIAMKTKNKEDSQVQNINSSVKSYHYYFHADEDFREDYIWGKTNHTFGNKASADNQMPEHTGSS